jgi:hypothetical protein
MLKQPLISGQKVAYAYALFKRAPNQPVRHRLVVLQWAKKRKPQSLKRLALGLQKITSL